MTTYCQGRIYPQSVPEFRHLQKADGTIEMQVRYINSAMGYTGKWQPIRTEQEQPHLEANHGTTRTPSD